MADAKNKNASKPEAKAKDESAPKRKMLTAEERVAKLEADLAAAKERAAAKADKRANELKSKIAKLKERRDRVNAQIDELETELAEEQGDDQAEDNEV